MLFLLSGNILARYQTKNILQVRGLLRAAPVTGVLWVAGFLAITGSPPFGPFLSKFTILKAALDGHHVWIVTMFLATLGVIFIGMATAFLGMAQGEPGKPAVSTSTRDRWWQIIPPAVLGILVLWLGLDVPSKLSDVLHQIATTLGGAS
jgi:hydrogenase-4 component F